MWTSEVSSSTVSQASVLKSVTHFSDSGEPVSVAEPQQEIYLGFSLISAYFSLRLYKNHLSDEANSRAGVILESRSVESVPLC